MTRIVDRRVSEMSARPSRRALTLALSIGVGALALRLWVLFHADYMFDDAFITWRMARNVAQGLGGVYNPGDRLQATSSPLHMLFCAGLWWLLGARAILADRVLGCFVDASTTLLIIQLTYEIGCQHAQTGSAAIGAACAGALHAVSGHTAFVAPAGLETPYYALAVVAACRYAGLGRFQAAAALGSIAALLRPDGALVWAVAGASALQQRRLGTFLKASTVWLLPGLVWQLAYYGSLVPQTVVAKSLVERSAQREWGELLQAFFIGGRRQLLCSALFALGWYCGGRSRAARPLLLWTLAYAVAFSSFGAWWPWYWAPLAAAMAVWAGLGLTFLTDLVGRRASSRGMAPVGGALVGVLLCVSSGTQLARHVSWGHKAAPFYRRQNAAIAAWLARHAQPDSSVLIERMGEVGFLLPLRIDDYPGLASSRITDALRTLARPIAWGPSDTGALDVIVRRVSPHYLVLREEEYRLATVADVLTRYEVVREIEAESEGKLLSNDYQPMLVLELAGGPSVSFW